MTASADLLVELGSDPSVDLVKVPVREADVSDRAVCIEESVIDDTCSASLGHPSCHVGLVVLRPHLNVVLLATLKEVIELLNLLNKVVIIHNCLTVLVLHIGRSWTGIVGRALLGLDVH